MRALFVDDEARILDGVGRMLRSQRNECSVSFASSGAAALELLEAGPVDLVVTDFRMPVMDGLELLDAVRETCPRAARVILSGQTDAAVSGRATAVAHVALTKPAESGSILRLVRTVREISRSVPVEVREAVGGYGSLPVSGPSLDSLRVAVESPDLDLADVAALAELEPAVAGKLLQAVNSSFFGRFPPASDVRDAIRMLGAPAIRQMIREGDAFRAGAAVPTATADLDRARPEGGPRASSGSTSLAPQLRLLGELLIADSLPSQYRRVRARVDSGVSRADAARAVLGASFATVGAYLAGLWNYPADLVGAIAGEREQALETSGFLATGSVS